MADVSVDLVAWCFARLNPKPFFHSRGSRRSALRRWASERLQKRIQPLQVMLGLLGVALAGEMDDRTNHRVRVWAKLRRGDPVGDSWWEYYRDGFRAFHEVWKCLLPDGGPADGMGLSAEAWTLACVAVLVQLRRAERGDTTANRTLTKAAYLQDKLLSACLDLATGADSNLTDPAGIEQEAVNGAWRFLLQVFVPCLLKHGRRPDQLFADAMERSDCVALQQLMAFDASVKDHPDIREWTAARLAKRDTRMRKAVGRVRLRPAKERQECSTLLISLLLKQFGQRWHETAERLRRQIDRQSIGKHVWSVLSTKRLNMTDIRQLLDAYSQDRGARLANFQCDERGNCAEAASWDRQVDRFRTRKRPVDVQALTARKTVRVES